MQAEYRFVFVRPAQWCVVPKFARKGWQFQFQWLFFYFHRVIVGGPS